MPLVTVFGGTGYLGRRVADRFAEQGWRVRIAARHAPDFAPAGASFESVSADIRDAGQVARAVRGADCVVDAVSAYVQRGEITYDAIHVAGARLLAESCAEADIACMVLVSGIGADANSRSHYIAARGRGEEAVRAALPTATVLRPSVMMGGAGGLLAALDGIARTAPVIPLIGGGRTRLQPVDVEDVAMAAAKVAQTESAKGRTFELGGAERLSLREIVERVLAASGRRRLLLPVPFGLARLLAAVGERLPGAPLTRAQVELLESDNLASADQPGLAELGIDARGLDKALDELRRRA